MSHCHKPFAVLVSAASAEVPLKSQAAFGRTMERPSGNPGGLSRFTPVRLRCAASVLPNRSRLRLRPMPQ